MPNTSNLPNPCVLVHTHVVTGELNPDNLDASPLHLEALGFVCEDGSGYKMPPADAYARRIAEEAEAWLEHARDRSRMRDDTLVRKALHALAFSLRHRAHDLAVPSKLSGTSKCQAVLWHLVKSGVGLGEPLDVEEQEGKSRPRLVVSHGGEALGEVQGKHVPWLRPLIPFGAGLYLVRVTGQERDYTLGCNVALGRVGGALAALRHALGEDVGGDGYGGERDAQTPTEVAGAEARSRPDHSGDGAPNVEHRAGEKGLRLVTPAAPPEVHPEADPDDIVLYRDIDGTARATVEHVVRHSPTGIEWGYQGSGPADLARSILLQFADETTADRHYVRFKEEVVAAVPRAGGVIRSADVRAWLAAQRHDAR